MALILVIFDIKKSMNWSARSLGKSCWGRAGIFDLCSRPSTMLERAFS